MHQERFQDQNKVLSDFYKEALVICPSCSKKAIASVDIEKDRAQLFCLNCGHNERVSTIVDVLGINGRLRVAANRFFGVGLWLTHPFKDDFFFAYNLEHLEYLEQYISAKLREHRDRTRFTLLEKLPKFYHEAKNREALLKIIQKLKNK